MFMAGWRVCVRKQCVPNQLDESQLRLQCQSKENQQTFQHYAMASTALTLQIGATTAGTHKAYRGEQKPTK